MGCTLGCDCDCAAVQGSHQVWFGGMMYSCRLHDRSASSRLEAGLFDEGVLREHSAHVLAVDRPGHGESSPHPTRNLTTFAGDRCVSRPANMRRTGNEQHVHPDIGHITLAKADQPSRQRHPLLQESRSQRLKCDQATNAHFLQSRLGC